MLPKGSNSNETFLQRVARRSASSSPSSHRVYSDEEEVEDSSSSSSLSSDDEWGSVRDGLNIDLASSSEEEEDGLFIPEPVLQLHDDSHKPLLSQYTVADLPVGQRVWVVDEEDVEMLLHSYWANAYKLVCNGRQQGHVQRHVGTMTLVTFHDDKTDVDFTLTLPRECLSKQVIEPYESRHCTNNVRVLGSYYCNVGPRASGRGSSSSTQRPARTSAQQLYERVGALDPPPDAKGILGDIHEKYLKGAFQDALVEVSEVLEMYVDTPRYLDALVMRSRVYVFLEQYALALQDALACVELEPQWVRGYLSAARAYSGLGNFEEAGKCIATSEKLLHSSVEVTDLQSLNNYLLGLKKGLEESGARLTLYLDHLYRKRFMLNHDGANDGDVLCVESTPIVAMPSVFGSYPTGRCAVCFRAGGEVMDFVSSYMGGHPSSNLVVSSESELCTTSVESTVAMFCSRNCQQRASLYAPMETKHREGVGRARELIMSKAAITIDYYPLEMANMTLRLFFMVISTHRRLIAQRKHSFKEGPSSVGRSRGGESRGVSDSAGDSSSHAPSLSPLPVGAALKHLGLYPLVSGHLSNRTYDELSVLYDTLTTSFKEESKKIYSKQLFESLYSYVHAYFMPIEIDVLPGSAGSSIRSANSALFESPPLRTTNSNSNNVTTSPATPIPTKEKVFYLPFVVGCSNRATAPNPLSRSPAAAARTKPPSSPADAGGIPCVVRGDADLRKCQDATKAAAAALKITPAIANCAIRQVSHPLFRDPSATNCPLPRAFCDERSAGGKVESPLLEMVVTAPSLRRKDDIVFPPFTIDLKDFL